MNFHASLFVFVLQRKMQGSCMSEHENKRYAVCRTKSMLNAYASCVGFVFDPLTLANRRRVRVAFLKKHTLGAMLPKRCIQEGNNFSGSRIRKLHLCHMHSFMHSSIPPMIDVGVLIRTGFCFTLVICQFN